MRRFLFAPIGNAATRRWALILSAAMLIGCGWVYLHYMTVRPPARTYRMGFRDSPPRQYVDAQGRPYGSVIDLLFAGRPIRVLVAEDNVVNQKVAVRMLERLGLRADVAANGREAVRMFELLPYDLVFMDCQMPEMDGYEASQEIRRREGPGRHVAIIAMTAHTLAGCREQCLEAGMDGFIAKPVSLEALFEALQRWATVKEPAPA